MEPSIQNFLSPDQDHTLTWLFYQILLKLNMDYGYTTNLLLYDITKFLSDDIHRYWIDFGLLTGLFYYLWKGKMDLENKSKFSYKILFINSSIAYIILKWDLDMFLWSIIITIVFCLIVADIVMVCTSLLQMNSIKLFLIMFIIYMIFR